MSYLKLTSVQRPLTKSNLDKVGRSDQKAIKDWENKNYAHEQRAQGVKTTRAQHGESYVRTKSAQWSTNHQNIIDGRRQQ